MTLQTKGTPGAGAHCITAAATSTEYPKAVAVGPDGAIYAGCCGRPGGLERFAWHDGELVSEWFVASSKVCGIAIAPDGRVCASVHDDPNPHVREFDPDGSVAGEWGRNHLLNPQGIAADPDGCFYVLEANRWGGRGYADVNGVLRFDRNGAFTGRWGRTGTAPGDLNLPVGIAVDDAGRVCVADSYNCRVQFFSPDGSLLQAWGRLGAEPGEFNCPQGIALGPHGRIYLADTYNNRVQVLSQSGEPLACWGEDGTEPGQLWLPCGVAVDRSCRVYVADTMNHRVQVFDGPIQDI